MGDRPHPVTLRDLAHTLAIEMALFGRENEQDQQRAEAWTIWLNQQNVYAIVSLVLGVFSLIEFGVLAIFGIAGIACGVVALRQLKRADSPRNRGHRLAWSGIITSVLSLVLAVLVYARVFG